MPKCPNCGLPTKRTQDWACQWCGHPLLSKSYPKIPKTYNQLKEERLYKQESPVAPEPEAEPVAEQEPEPEPEPEPEEPEPTEEEPETEELVESSQPGM